jgi:hypothetical protein
MFNRVIYTLYLFSRTRKDGGDVARVGGSVAFLICTNLLATATIICHLQDIPFGAIFVEYEIIILTGALVCFSGMQLYTSTLIKKIKAKQKNIKRTDPLWILIYSIFSVILLLYSMTLL